MSSKNAVSIAPASTTTSHPPRVTVEMVWKNADYSHPTAPDGDEEEMKLRLRAAFATSSDDFVRAALFRLQQAAQMPTSGPSIKRTAMNSALAHIESLSPGNEAQAALAVQIASSHAAYMCVMARLGDGFVQEKRLTVLVNAATKLMNANTAALTLYQKLQGRGHQHVVVEHVTVNSGGQAIVGNVTTSKPGA